MQATWSDTDYEESDSTTSEDERYDHNDFLAFVAFVESMHDIQCDSDSDDGFTNDQKAPFLNNLVVEHEKLIKNYLKDHDIIEAHKTKIDMLNEEMSNLLEKKKRFLESKHHYLLARTNAPT